MKPCRQFYWRTSIDDGITAFFPSPAHFSWMEINYYEVTSREKEETVASREASESSRIKSKIDWIELIMDL